uniref:Uncharacterized protein n=1 Tax=Anguilla anguilla TaxID=7936 RepID=A0A0E9VXB5_ANGAN
MFHPVLLNFTFLSHQFYLLTMSLNPFLI